MHEREFYRQKKNPDKSIKIQVEGNRIRKLTVAKKKKREGGCRKSMLYINYI